MILRVASKLTVVLNGGSSSMSCQPSSKADARHRLVAAGRIRLRAAPAPALGIDRDIGVGRPVEIDRGRAASETARRRWGALARRADAPAGVSGLSKSEPWHPSSPNYANKTRTFSVLPVSPHLVGLVRKPPMIWWQRRPAGSGSMISVVIATHELERSLVHTLAALVPGALAGLGARRDRRGRRLARRHRQGRRPCRLSFHGDAGAAGARLAAAAAAARGTGCCSCSPAACRMPAGSRRPSASCARANSQATRRTGGGVPAARAGTQRSSFAKALSLIATAFGARPKPSQGLLIAKSLYDAIGGHDARQRQSGNRFAPPARPATHWVLGSAMVQAG